MYLECETWLGEKFVCKVNFIQGLLILFFCDNKTLMKVKRLSKKEIIFTKVYWQNKYNLIQYYCNKERKGVKNDWNTRIDFK